jgi:membrane-bound serine protease (ClpP class)
MMRILLLLGLLIAAVAAQVRAASPTVVVLDIKGVINPVLADFVGRGIEEAEDNNATAIIIQMDAPGGLLTSMLEIVEDIIGARVPVVVYVSPAGAWAASAGVFITMAAHVAVMAPATNIGAAHPVTLGDEGEEGLSETEEEKILSILASKAKTWSLMSLIWLPLTLTTSSLSLMVWR